MRYLNPPEANIQGTVQASLTSQSGQFSIRDFDQQRLVEKPLLEVHITTQNGLKKMTETARYVSAAGGFSNKPQPSTEKVKTK